jgi:mannose/fructose/N-acetylgalactosamine-specific phosphotransferase system component IIC
MAKGNKKEKKLNFSLTPFLYIGFVIVCVTALLQSFVPNFPEGLRNILYIVGVLAMVVYMFQIAFEKRTGKRENDVPAKENKSKNRK